MVVYGNYLSHNRWLESVVHATRSDPFLLVYALAQRFFGDGSFFLVTDLEVLSIRFAATLKIIQISAAKSL